MAVLTAQTISLAGVVVTSAAAASGGDSFPNDGRTHLSVTNAHATLSRTVTINSLQANNFGTDENVTVVVAALTTARIGPFNIYRFNDSAGRVGVTYSDLAADLTVACVRLGPTVP